MLPLYEDELTQFKERVANLDREQVTPRSKSRPRLKAAPFVLLSSHAETYKLKVGVKPFTDREYRVLQLAEELEGLTAVRFSHEAGKSGRRRR